MKEFLVKLTANIDVQIKKHKTLLSMLKKKLSAIIDQDWRRLQDIVQKSNLIVSQIKELEVERLMLVENITGNRKTTISNLITGIQENEGKVIKEKANELLMIMKNIEDVALQIETLLQTSLQVIDYTVSLLSGNGSSGLLYGTGGKEKKAEENNYPLVLNIKA